MERAAGQRAPGSSAACFFPRLSKPSCGPHFRVYAINHKPAGLWLHRSHTGRFIGASEGVLHARIDDGVVTCEPKDTDQYGRTVAICRVYGEDLGAWMVGLGYAVAYRSYTTRYVPAEELAKRRKAGMWAGSFTAPAEWRKLLQAR